MVVNVGSEVRTGPLSDREVRQFVHSGYVLPGKVFDDDTIIALRNRMDQLLTSTDSDGLVNRLSTRATKENEGASADTQIPVLEGLWRTDELFRNVSFDNRFITWAGQLLGTSKIAFLQDIAVLKPPNQAGELYWHQDWNALPLKPSNFLGVWIALEDVNAANGAMEMVPGSPSLGRFLPSERSAASDHLNASEYLAEGLKPMPDPVETGFRTIPLELSMGECSMHHGLMWHRSGSNTTQSMRHSLIVRFADANTSVYTGRQHSVVKDEPHSDAVGARLSESDVYKLFDVPDAAKVM
jgi:phytanoyl-CoA hydroxylase